MIGRLRMFLLLWYDFVVGDDWRVAVGVVAALAATAASPPPDSRAGGSCPSRSASSFR